MDPARFDGFVRVLGAARTRRAVLGTLLAGAVVPLLDGEDAGAGRRGKRGKRRQRRVAAPQAPQAGACDVCEKDCQFSSVQAAMDAANAGDTIRICAGTYKSNPTLYTNKSLTLAGAGADETVLKGGGFVRVFMVGPSAAVTLRDLAIEGGLEQQKQRGGGAGILILDRGSLTLERCLVERNVATEGGGIVVSKGSTLTAIDSEISGNTASAIGAGLVVREGGKATLEGSTRVGDNNVNVWGGGIYTVGELTVTSRVRIDRNKAGGHGGGIFAARPGAATFEAGSLVTDNKAAQGGGGLFNDRAPVTLADTTIVVDNDPQNCGGAFGTQTANCVN